MITAAASMAALWRSSGVSSGAAAAAKQRMARAGMAKHAAVGNGRRKHHVWAAAARRSMAAKNSSGKYHEIAALAAWHGITAAANEKRNRGIACGMAARVAAWRQ